MTRYISTRQRDTTEYSFTDVLLTGLAPDGGLFVPQEIPALSSAALSSLRTCSYGELAHRIIALFVGDAIPDTDLKTLINAAYCPTVFSDPSITPLTELSTGLYLQDLSTGPSLAFKDLAMQFLGQVLDYQLQREDRYLTILGASSGDTVSAAEEALRAKSRINVMMLTPKTGMSDFQKAQAGAILDPNIYNISIPGPFDRCQDLVKAINADPSFKSNYAIGAVNSINWGRICAQIVYYIYGYFQVTSQLDQVVDVVVPSGNFGNILAGYVAKKMGVPLGRLIVATNENNILDRFFKTGIYEQQSVIVTSSPSMDISKASNIERLFFDLMGRDAAQLNQAMAQFESTQTLDLSSHFETIHHQIGFRSGLATHQDRIQTIQRVYQNSQHIIDPHTAAGVHVAQQYHEDTSIPMICMETAKPTKFEATIQEALSFVPERPDQYKGLEAQKQRFFDLPDDEEAIKTFIADHVSIRP